MVTYLAVGAVNDGVDQTLQPDISRNDGNVSEPSRWKERSAFRNPLFDQILSLLDHFGDAAVDANVLASFDS